MGLFDKIFKSDDEIAKQEIKTVPWNEIVHLDMLDEISMQSRETTVAILKHSTTCGISRMVLRQFEKDYNLDQDTIKLYFLDLLKFRDISNKIASRFNVPHESPQLIIIKNEKVEYSASHGEITAESISPFLK